MSNKQDDRDRLEEFIPPEDLDAMVECPGCYATMAWEEAFTGNTSPVYKCPICGVEFNSPGN